MYKSWTDLTVFCTVHTEVSVVEVFACMMTWSGIWTSMTGAEISNNRQRHRPLHTCMAFWSNCGQPNTRKWSHHRWALGFQGPTCRDHIVATTNVHTSVAVSLILATFGTPSIFANTTFFFLTRESRQMILLSVGRSAPVEGVLKIWSLFLRSVIF